MPAAPLHLVEQATLPSQSPELVLERWLRVIGLLLVAGGALAGISLFVRRTILARRERHRS